MTLLQYHLSQYPNGDTIFPFHIDIHPIERTFPTHRHDFLECAYVQSGTGTEEVNGQSFSLQPGTLAFIRPFDTHAIHCDQTEGSLVLYNINFRPELFASWELASSSLYPLLYERSKWPHSHVQLQGEARKRAEVLTKDMHKAYLSSSPHRYVRLQAQLTDLLLLFFEAAQNQPAKEGTRPADTWQVLDYIHAHFREPLRLKDLASTFHVSASYLSEKIISMCGKPFTAYLHELRVRHACSLLHATRMAIADIAEASGFVSIKTFSRVFKSYTGKTPSAYRKETQWE
ncbi:AraC family transcriptional regulator [Bacillaceae bacterium SIJ1]|uniref:AraC family transcriptional regulator n=1 Tax=Litoribacterium kuwaitense TaxID=1398745 RepID=UPI0013ED0C6B|nr:AraC family transcriptional regulator [Litoribacterium kuwaitense]NGP45465.1 AraC family transcriptional regulator [Litoribacterium kuwaitense]